MEPLWQVLTSQLLTKVTSRGPHILKRKIEILGYSCSGCGQSGLCLGAEEDCELALSCQLDRGWGSSANQFPLLCPGWRASKPLDHAHSLCSSYSPQVILFHMILSTGEHLGSAWLCGFLTFWLRHWCANCRGKVLQGDLLASFVENTASVPGS